MGNARPRIVLFTTCFGHGGTEHQFAQIVTRIDRERFDVNVACLHRRGQFLEMVRAAGLDICEFPVAGLSYSTLSSARRLLSFLRHKRVRLVHTFDLYTNLFAATVARLAGVPAVVCSRRDLGTMWSPTRRWLQRRAFQISHAVVANSQAACDVLMESDGVPVSRIHLVRNGVDLCHFSPQPVKAARARLKLPGKAPLVGVIANLRPEKDHQTLLAAVPQVVARVPAARFLIVGAGPTEAALRRYVELRRLHRHVWFLGNRSDVAELLCALDVVVLPSTTESLPNIVLESMSAGRALIAPAVGGCIEVVDTERTGILVPPRDPEALALQITRLLSDAPLRERLGGAARRRALEEFDISMAVHKLEAVYDSLLVPSTAVVRAETAGGLAWQRSRE